MSFLTSPRGTMGYVWGALAGALSALILAYALANAGSMTIALAYVVTVPLFMAGLGAGTVATVLGGIVGTAVLVALSGIEQVGFYAVADALPAAMLTGMALSMRRDASGAVNWCGGGRLLAILAVYPTLVFLALFILIGTAHGGLLAMTVEGLAGMEAQFTHMISESGEKITPEIMDRIRATFALLAKTAPGLAMSAWLISTMVSMTVAQWLLASNKWNLRPFVTLTGLRVPSGIVYAAAATGLMAAFAPAPFDYLGLNLAIVLGMPFFFVGLAVVHALAKTTRAPLAFLIVFYVVMTFIVHLALLVAAIGAVDQWADFRKRLASGSNNEGEKQ